MADKMTAVSLTFGVGSGISQARRFRMNRKEKIAVAVLVIIAAPLAVFVAGVALATCGGL
ncbi:MAG TPA: hypothetical protein VLK22_03505 [Candidatus Udaeobacter sp.]|nr:hypothetical protein [Candidatus Udaeobacter sp.]